MTEVTTLWTDERVAHLRRRWAEGGTSSAIAIELSLTRNAVIGKANRLGLMGARKPDAPKRRPRMPWTQEREATLLSMHAEGKGSTRIAKALGGVSPDGVTGMMKRLGLIAAATPETEIPGLDEPFHEVDSDPEVFEVSSVQEAIQVQAFIRSTRATRDSAPEMDGLAWQPATERPPGPVTIMGLREGVCRWPVGDPKHADFHYCGGVSIKGKPYCVGHAGLAYTAPDPRRRPVQWTFERTQQARARGVTQMAARRPGAKSQKYAAVPAE